MFTWKQVRLKLQLSTYTQFGIKIFIFSVFCSYDRLIVLIVKTNNFVNKESID